MNSASTTGSYFCIFRNRVSPSSSSPCRYIAPMSSHLADMIRMCVAAGQPVARVSIVDVLCMYESALREQPWNATTMESLGLLWQCVDFIIARIICYVTVRLRHPALAAQRSSASVTHSCRRYAGHVQNTIKFLSMSVEQARRPYLRTRRYRLLARRTAVEFLCCSSECCVTRALRRVETRQTPRQSHRSFPAPSPAAHLMRASGDVQPSK